jgi:hypothetical protein
MKFNLYVELCTRSVDTSLADLLLFPGEQMLPERVKWKANWWTGGRTRRAQVVRRESILKKLSPERFNELEIRFTGEPARPGARATIVEGWLYMSPSPFSALWAPVPNERLASPKEERSRKTFHAGDSAQWKQRFQKPVPSDLECSLEVELHENPSDDDELQVAAVGVIQDAMPEPFSIQDAIGYGCLRGTCRRQSTVRNLGSIPEATDSLGEKFESIYPILIGSTRLCEELAASLEGLGTVKPLGTNGTTSILSIPPSRFEQAKAIRATQNYTIDVRALAEKYREQLLRER